MKQFILKITLPFVYFLTAQYFLNAQIIISGKIKDQLTGETLIGANILDEKSGDGTATNAQGFFSIQVPRGKQTTLRFSYVGYQTDSVIFYARKDTALILSLSQIANLGEVQVIAKSAERDVERRQLGFIRLPVQVIEKMPALLGETDVLKSLAMLPGVKMGSEANVGLYVRGGTPDQNLILLDDAPVYNPSHLFGLFSTFNTDALKSVQFYKGGFPARYGGKASSVIDINMKEGNFLKRRVSAGVGILSSHFLIEGPIEKEQSSYFLSARASYLGILAALAQSIGNAGTNNSELVNYNLFDINAKVNQKIGDNKQLFLSFYTGADYFSTSQKTDAMSSRGELFWRNTTATLRYNQVLSPKSSLKAILYYSAFKYLLSGQEKLKLRTDSTAITRTTRFESASALQDVGLKIHGDYYANNRSTFRYGIDAIQHWFRPSVVNLTSQENIETNNVTLNNVKIPVTELALFVENEYDLLPRLRLHSGLRFNNVLYENQYFKRLEPRIALSYSVPSQTIFKLGYSQMNQFNHLLTNNGLGLPNDIWVPVTSKAPPQQSTQFSFGIDQILPYSLDFQIDMYYKTLTKQIDYAEGANILYTVGKKWDDLIVNGGTGRAYGFEFLLRRSEGRFNGFLSYTLARNERKFAGVNDDNYYPHKYDRRHEIATSASYQISKRWEVSGNWTFYTGNAFTLPKSKILSTGTNSYESGLIIYGARNQARFPNYHRLDIAFSRISHPRWARETKLTFGLYNAYNRLNPFLIQLENKYNVDTNGNLLSISKNFVQKTLFPVVPSIFYAIKF